MRKTMKTFIIMNSNDFSDIVPRSVNHPGQMFPIANKPLIAHWMDFAIHCGSRDIYMLSKKPLDQSIRDWFGDGSRWGVRVSFMSSALQSLDLDQIIAKIHTNKDSRYMIIKGVFFIQYDKKQDYADLVGRAPSGTLASCPTGNISVFGPGAPSGGDAQTGAAVRMIPVHTLDDLLQISIQTLSGCEGRFFLPGYTQANGVIMGKDTVIDPSARLVPPVMIGDHVRIHENVTVGPHVVVGNDVVIDSHTELMETVVFDKTYVGSHLTLSHKLVNGATLIDPLNHNVIELEEQQLLAPMKPGEGGDDPSGFWSAFVCRLKRALSLSSYRRKGPLSNKTV